MYFYNTVDYLSEHIHSFAIMHVGNMYALHNAASSMAVHSPEASRRGGGRTARGARYLASSSAVPQPICNALPVLSTTTRLWPGLRSGVGWYAGGAMRLAMTLWTDGDGRVA
eukprot:COSAG02_NODE_954_length_15689_cov_14.145927_3_plen_112_part_00